MEKIISQLLQDFENGKMSRRQLIQSLALTATAASGVALTGTAAEAASGFKTIALDHISYQVVDYKKTRDFYTDLIGMTVSDDNGNNQCQLHFGESMVIARNRPAAARQSRVDHIAYRIDDWNTDRVKAELDRRQLKPRLDTGGPAGPPNFASFHVSDPDGFDLQISGVVKPGDSLYKKSGANR
jgi:catechol 2,3-dioxygenase-like lactoylglutathione lyase family enzyme